MRQSEQIPTRFLRFFFYFLYQPFAWSYDFVAWLVSLGQWKAWIQTVLPELHGSRVLELGHGTGHLQVAMRKKGQLAFGADLSSQMGKIAAKRIRTAGSNPLLVRAEAQFLPFVARSFDQAVATFPSEYILDPKTLNSVHRVLLPGGRAVILPVAWITGRGPLRRIAAWLFRVTKQAGRWTSLFSDAFLKAGFTVNEKHARLPGSELVLLIATKPS